MRFTFLHQKQSFPLFPRLWPNVKLLTKMQKLISSLTTSLPFCIYTSLWKISLFSNTLENVTLPVRETLPLLIASVITSDAEMCSIYAGSCSWGTLPMSPGGAELCPKSQLRDWSQFTGHFRVHRQAWGLHACYPVHGGMWLFLDPLWCWGQSHSHMGCWWVLRYGAVSGSIALTMAVGLHSHTSLLSPGVSQSAWIPQFPHRHPGWMPSYRWWAISKGSLTWSPQWCYNFEYSSV